jgi:hypothetical protein
MGAETAELAADQAEQRSRWAANHTARPGTPESVIEDITVPNTPPLAGNSQGDTTAALSQTPERLQGPGLAPALASETQGTPEPQVQPPVSTAPTRIQQGSRKRRRVFNKLYRDSPVRAMISQADGEV